MKAEIDKRVELVQILLYLADEQEKTIQYLEKVMKSDMIIYKFKESRVI